MIKQQLLDYVRDQLTSGFPKEGIKRELAIQGWDEQNINEVFSLLEKSSTIVAPIISTTNQVYTQTQNLTQTNKIWLKFIPVINMIFMGISLVVMFVINIFILATDMLKIGEIGLFFYGIMFVPLVIFVSFYLYENKKLSVRFLNTKSKADPWILALIIIRNIVFILNFIPFIQIAGAMALVSGGIPYLIIYSLLLKKR